MIRRAADRDLEYIMQLVKKHFLCPATAEANLLDLHENEFGHFYVLEENQKIAGFIDFWITFECCQLANIAVHPSFQRRGYSRSLMDFMIVSAEQEQCETIMLEVRPSNEAARCLYDSYEFMKVNIRKGYYNDNGEDAIVMCKALGGNLV